MGDHSANAGGERGAGRRPQAATPIAFVRTILRAYDKYDADPSQALRLAGIGPSDLRHSDARVTAGQLEVLTDFAMRELDDEGLGWFSRKLPWGSYGMLCRASLTAPNLGIALKRWCRHHRLLTDDIVLHLSITGPLARLSIGENRRLREMRELCLLTSLRHAQGYACWAIDSRIQLHEVDFPFEAPLHADVYPLMFRGPVRFGAAQAGITFDTQYLSLPLCRDERALRTMLRRALPLTVREYRSDRLLVWKMRHVLRAHGTELRTGASVARALKVSLRTLHRRLLEEGTSLQKVKDEVRRDLATELIIRTSRSIKQIAGEVGFNNAKSFMRAFKQWTGESPVAYRRNHCTTVSRVPSSQSQPR
jgi:AraC-like DNA-binding protein